MIRVTVFPKPLSSSTKFIVFSVLRVSIGLDPALSPSPPQLLPFVRVRRALWLQPQMLF